MAALFVWVFITDKMKNTKLLEENTKMLEALSKSTEALSKSNENIATSLDLIQNNMLTLDGKADRNYEHIVKCTERKKQS